MSLERWQKRDCGETESSLNFTNNRDPLKGFKIRRGMARTVF